MNNNNGHNAPQIAEQPAQPTALDIKYAIAMQQLGNSTNAIFELQAELEITKRMLAEVSRRNMQLEYELNALRPSEVDVEADSLAEKEIAAEASA